MNTVGKDNKIPDTTKVLMMFSIINKNINALIGTNTNDTIKLDNIVITFKKADKKNQKIIINDIMLNNSTRIAKTDDKKTENVDASLQLSANNISNTDPKTAAFTPENINFKIRSNDAPLKQITSTKSTDEALKHTHIILDRASLNAPNYGLDAKGEMNNDTAFATISLRGIPDLMQWITSPNTPQMNGESLIPPQIVAALAIIQLVGKPGTDEQGRPSLTYELKRDATGKTTLNGADISNITKQIKP
jgi:hypothetical protein